MLSPRPQIEKASSIAIHTCGANCPTTHAQRCVRRNTPFSGQFRRQCMHFGNSAGNFGGSTVRRPVGYNSAAAMSKLVALLPNYMQIVQNWSEKGVLLGPPLLGRTCKANWDLYDSPFSSSLNQPLNFDWLDFISRHCKFQQYVVELKIKLRKTLSQKYCTIGRGIFFSNVQLTPKIAQYIQWLR